MNSPERASRLARMDGFESMAATSGVFLSPLIFNKFGYFGSFGFFTGFSAMAFGYMAFCVK